MVDYIQAARDHFYELVKKYEEDRYFTLVQHVPMVERWAVRIADEYPEADNEVVALGAWLHDSGHYLNNEEDHAISSEKDAKEFLEGLGYPKVDEVLHCVRSHRCKDVLPDTIEAKIVAFADSASHMSDCIYLDILRMWGREYTLGKLERDWRDVNNLPQGKQLEPLYTKWKALIEEMPEWTHDLEIERKIAMRYVDVP